MLTPKMERFLDRVRQGGAASGVAAGKGEGWLAHHLATRGLIEKVTVFVADVPKTRWRIKAAEEPPQGRDGSTPSGSSTPGGKGSGSTP